MKVPSCIVVTVACTLVRSSESSVGPSVSLWGGGRRNQHHKLPLPKVSTNTVSLEPATGTAFRGGAAAATSGPPAIVLPTGNQNFDTVVQCVGLATKGLLFLGQSLLPPTIAATKAIVRLYRALPRDVVMMQIGLVYVFAGGYYPTLFSSLQAAQQCGWNVMVDAVGELTDEAIKVVEATSAVKASHRRGSPRDVWLRNTNIVMRTVDPHKINTAAAALYTTWLGVSAVLEKEYARVISLSLTLSSYMEVVAHWIVEPPFRWVVSAEYQKWIPIMTGWICKAAAMNIAWRMQRVLTASTSAMTGGVMFARALVRLITARRGRRRVRWGDPRPDPTRRSRERFLAEDLIGFCVAGLGFYTQVSAQYKSNFSFEVPFPISLVTWPFDWAEKWIQWQITK